MRRLALAAVAAVCLATGSVQAASSWRAASGSNLIAANESLGAAGSPHCDVNQDGSVTPVDALAVLRMFAGLEPQEAAADVNGDGQVTPVDALTVLRNFAGLASC